MVLGFMEDSMFAITLTSKLLAIMATKGKTKAGRTKIVNKHTMRLLRVRPMKKVMLMMIATQMATVTKIRWILLHKVPARNPCILLRIVSS